jgi:hypothetical protein
MYVIKNMDKLDTIPERLKNNYVFKQLFHKAEIAKMSQEERDDYEHSLKKYIDMTTLIKELEVTKKQLAENKKENAKNRKIFINYQQVIAEKDKFITEKDKEIAYLRQIFRTPDSCYL